MKTSIAVRPALRRILAVAALAAALPLSTFGGTSARAVAAPAAPSNQADDMKAYADLIRAQADFERALAEAQLNYARAELTRAQAAQEWQEARRLAVLVNSLTIRLRHQAREQAQLARKIEHIEDHVRGANLILAGNVNPRALRSLRTLQIQVVGAAATREAMTLPVGALGESEFRRSYPSSEIVAFQGGNLGQLVTHLTEKRLGLAPWGEGHLALVEGLEIMTQAVVSAVAQLEERRHELNDPDNLPDIVSKPAST